MLFLTINVSRLTLSKGEGVKKDNGIKRVAFQSPLLWRGNAIKLSDKYLLFRYLYVYLV